jgi:hypothetical protein
MPSPADITHFEPSCFTCTTHVRHVDLELSLFRQPQSNQESVFITRRLIQIRPKFWWHNLDVLRYTISGVLLKNNGVMLPKFHPDLNLTYHHKHTLSVTLWWV